MFRNDDPSNVLVDEEGEPEPCEELMEFERERKCLIRGDQDHESLQGRDFSKGGDSGRSNGRSHLVFILLVLIVLVPSMVAFKMMSSPSATIEGGHSDLEAQRVSSPKSKSSTVIVSGNPASLSDVHKETMAQPSSSSAVMESGHTQAAPKVEEEATEKRSEHGGVSEELPQDSSTGTFPFTDLQLQQIENYKAGKALIINVHIVHHGGTTVCEKIGLLGPTPSFVCLLVREADNVTNPDYPPDEASQPWTHDQTSKNIAIVREYFHMISWEYHHTRLPRPPLPETNWEDPNLISIFVMRDPISRLLAGPHTNMTLDGKRWYPPEEKRTKQQWWDFAIHPANDNLPLEVLAAPGCCDGENTSQLYYERAQDLIRRFTFVLDIACLDQGLEAVARHLGLPWVDSNSANVHGDHRKTPRMRIGHDDVYDYLVRRNRPTMDLYEWSKTRSLVNCSALGP